jgi:hypothetical protein
MFLPYFCTPFEKRVIDLVAQLVEHPDFIGSTLESKIEFRD